MTDTLPSPTPVPETDRRDVIVVGSGLVGLCSALWLQRLGHRVRIIDREPPLGNSLYEHACSYGNACTVAPHAVIPVATPGIVWRVPGMLANPAGPLAIMWSYMPQLAPWLRGFIASSGKAEVERIATVLEGLLAYADLAYQPLFDQADTQSLLRHDGCLYLYKSEAEFQGARSEVLLRERHGVRVEHLDKAAIRALEIGRASCRERVSCCV